MNTQKPFRARCSHQGDVCYEFTQFEHLKSSDTVSVFTPALSPVPVQRDTGVITGSCNVCASVGPSGLPGYTWASLLLNGVADIWQGTPQDLMALQTANFSASSSKVTLCSTSAPVTSGCCHKYGWKKYGAKKQWHGDPGFIRRNDDSTRTGKQTGVNFTSAGLNAMPSGGFYAGIFTPFATSSDTKYLTMLAGVTTSTTSQGPSAYPDHSSSYSSLTTVDGNKGTYSSHAVVSSDYDGDYFNDPATNITDAQFLFQTTKSLNTMASNYELNFNFISAFFCNFISGATHFTGVTTAYTTQSGNDYYLHSGSNGFDSVPGDAVAEKITIDFAAGTFERWVYDYDNNGVYFLSYHQTCSVTDTELHYYSVYNVSDQGVDFLRMAECHIDLVLSVTNKDSDVDTKLVSMLDKWKLNGPEPFRVDGWLGHFPLVMLREVQGNVQPPVIFDPSAVDPNIALGFDGAIIGAPITISSAYAPGAYGWFDFYYLDIRYCIGGSGCPDTFPAYNYAFGGNLADAIVSVSNTDYVTGPQLVNILPGNATHWTSNALAHDLPRGALMDYGLDGDGAKMMVKAAFTRLPVPSYNFFRPCGGDRVLIDEPTSQFFTGGLAMGGALPDGGSYPALSTQTLLIFGTATDDGIYTGCSQDGSFNLTLGTKIASLPTDYSRPFTPASGLVGIVRFPNAPGTTAGCSPLCGRQQMTFTDNGDGTTNVKFVSPQTNLRTADALDFTDASGTAIQNNISVTRIDDSNFKIATAFASMAGAVWAMSHGAPAYYWNDTAQKFDARYASWLTQGRPGTDVGGTQTAFCLPLSECDPQVIAFSPNGETWPSIQTPDGLKSAGLTLWFGESNLQNFVPDMAFPCRVQANAEFEIPDLLWQAPQATTGYTLVEDDGTCSPDDTIDDPEIIHFPPRPRVEARLDSAVFAGPTRSSSPPALPTDSLGHTAAWPAMIEPSAPGVSGLSYTLNLEPWMRYQNEIVSIKAGGCRFLNFYLAHTLGDDR